MSGGVSRRRYQNGEGDMECQTRQLLQHEYAGVCQYFTLRVSIFHFACVDISVNRVLKIDFKMFSKLNSQNLFFFKCSQNLLFFLGEQSWSISLHVVVIM